MVIGEKQNDKIGDKKKLKIANQIISLEKKIAKLIKKMKKL